RRAGHRLDRDRRGPGPGVLPADPGDLRAALAPGPGRRGPGPGYAELEEQAAAVPPGARGLTARLVPADAWTRWAGRRRAGTRRARGRRPSQGGLSQPSRAAGVRRPVRAMGFAGSFFSGLSK